MTPARIDEESYVAQIDIHAPRERVFEALTTLDGLAGWWTPAVSGAPTIGDELAFAFNDQRVMMRVDSLDPLSSVAWTCRAHTRFPEWRNTSVRFDLDHDGAGVTRLTFRHIGLAPDCDCYGMCSNGWDFYLRSLADLCERGAGSPWGTQTWRPATA